MPESDPARTWFKCTDAERAAFEAGIKLGALYHQFVGAAVNAASVDSLEEAMAASLRTQPFVEGAQVRLDRKSLRQGPRPYDESSLTGEMMDVSVQVRYGESAVVGRLRYVPELGYPLMSLEAV
jgi:hypothetical protein